MYTQCPHCHAIFRMDAATLSEAGGRVQCGECELGFDALVALRDELPGAEVHWQNTELPFTLPESEPDEPDVQESDVARDRTPAPLTPPSWPRDAGGGSRIWLAASVLLAFVLVGQFVFAAPPTLSGHPGLRPVAQVLCRLSGCTIPPRVDLDRLRLASRDVRAHPSAPGALIISATLVNDAPFTQPYPVLEISLGDLQGRQVAIRRFEPATYLPGSVDVERGMAPGSRVQANLEVVDPGESAVAFQFAFRPARKR